MSDLLKWLVILTCGAWVLVLFAFILYFGWVYLELKRIGLNRAQQADLPKEGEA